MMGFDIDDFLSSTQGGITDQDLETIARVLAGEEPGLAEFLSDTFIHWAVGEQKSEDVPKLAALLVGLALRRMLDGVPAKKALGISVGRGRNPSPNRRMWRDAMIRVRVQSYCASGEAKTFTEATRLASRHLYPSTAAQGGEVHLTPDQIEQICRDGGWKGV